MSEEAHTYWVSFLFFCDVIQLLMAVSNPSTHSLDFNINSIIQACNRRQLRVINTWFSLWKETYIHHVYTLRSSKYHFGTSFSWSVCCKSSYYCHKVVPQALWINLLLKFWTRLLVHWKIYYLSSRIYFGICLCMSSYSWTNCSRPSYAISILNWYSCHIIHDHLWCRITLFELGVKYLLPVLCSQKHWSIGKSVCEKMISEVSNRLGYGVHRARP